MKTSLQDQAAALAAAHDGDPAGFQQAWAEQRSDYMAKVPARNALDMGAYYDQVGSDTYRPLLATSVMRDHALAIKSIGDRIDRVTQDVSNEYASGAPLATVEQSPTVQSGLAEIQGLVSAQTAATYGPRTDANATNFDAANSAALQPIVQGWKADAYTGHVLNIRRTQGAAAALAEVQRFSNADAAQASPAAATTTAPAAPPSPGAQAATAAASTGGDPAGVGSSAAVPAPTVGQPSAVPASASAPAAGTSGPTAPSGPSPVANNGTASSQGASAGAWETGVNITPQERKLMVAKATEALAQADSLQAQITNQVQVQRTAAQQALDQRMQAEKRYELLNGKASGVGPQDPEINSVFGPDRVTQYAEEKAAALKQNTAEGLWAGMTSDEQAQQASKEAAMKPLDTDLSTPEKVGALTQTIFTREGGVAPDGTPIANSAGALGRAQMLVGTARQVAAAHGLTSVAAMSDAQLRSAMLARDQQLNTQLGNWAVGDLAQKYGDPTKVAVAYHGGFSYVNGQVVSPVVEKADAAFGVLGTQTPVSQWLHRLATEPLPGNTKPMPVTAQYAQDIADGLDQGQKVVAAQQTLARMNQVTADAVSDPLSFAQGHGWGQPAPLNLQGFASPNPQDQAAFGQALKTRLTQGQVLATLHPTVPARMLTSAEAESYRLQLARDPSAGLKLASAAVSAVGQAGAYQLLDEIKAGGATPAVGMVGANLVAAGRKQASQAFSAGISAQQNGVPEAPTPKVNGQDGWSATMNSYRPAFAYSLPLMGVTEAAARLIRQGDPTPSNDLSAYVRTAMGGGHNPQTGEDFGGVAPVNGVPTVYPPYMKVGTMPAALRVVGDNAGPNGPLFSNGQPMRGRDLARLQPRLQADGSYELYDPGSRRVAGVRGGAPFRVDFDSYVPALQKTGGIVGHGM